jgi:hypothetical protein
MLAPSVPVTDIILRTGTSELRDLPRLRRSGRGRRPVLTISCSSVFPSFVSLTSPEPPTNLRRPRARTPALAAALFPKERMPHMYPARHGIPHGSSRNGESALPYWRERSSKHQFGKLRPAGNATPGNDTNAVATEDSSASARGCAKCGWPGTMGRHSTRELEAQANPVRSAHILSVPRGPRFERKTSCSPLPAFMFIASATPRRETSAPFEIDWTACAIFLSA